MEVVLCWCFLLFFITCGLTGRGFKTPHSYLYQLKLTIILFLSDEYVICLGCKSPDTILTKENRLFFLRCEKVNFLYPFAFFSFSSSSFTPSFLPTQQQSYFKHDGFLQMVNFLLYFQHFIEFIMICVNLEIYFMQRGCDGSFIIFQFYFFTTNKWTSNCTYGF